MSRGTCVICGCTDARACPGGCWWIDDGHEICSSHARHQVELARRRLAISPAPARRDRAVVAGPLVWRRGRGNGTQVADVMLGSYLLTRSAGNWLAQWLPRKGRRRWIVAGLGVPESKAKEACERHRIEAITDRMLENAGAGALVITSLQREPTAWRKGARRAP